MVDAKEILKFCLERGLLLDQEVLSLLEESDVETSKLILDQVVKQTHKKVITKSLFNENKDRASNIFLSLPEDKQKSESVQKLKIKLGMSIEISKEISVPKSGERGGEKLVDNEKDDKRKLDFGEGLSVTSMFPILSKKIEVKDFVKHYRNRFSEIQKILQNRTELKGLTSINKIPGQSGRQGFSIIGIVSDKRVTKNKNILIELEDLTGKIVALVNHNKEDLYRLAEEITLDSVIGICCSGNREIVFVNDLVFPDLKIHERKKSPVEEYALFIGDTHIGSKLFMKENFLKFIDYLNGKLPGSDKPEVEKIKTVFFVGDIVSGVGIFPGQERELTRPDIEEQYEYAAELLGKIREDIKIVLSPGNHDSVRIMEPQPVLDEKYAWSLHDMKNVILTTNPAVVKIGEKKDLGFEGFNVLTYHGYSYHYYANNIPRLLKEKAAHDPVKIMSYLLKNRHLAPTHSSTLYFPSEQDHALIRNPPDILVSGHTHKSGVLYYNNILNISVSSWESKTAFQEKMGNEPDFCKVPMFNLKTRALKVLDFE